VGRRRDAADGGETARVATFELGGERFVVVSQPAGAVATRVVLTAAERVIVSLVVDGRSNAQIAAARGTSVHTVGNQLAAIFRKLDVRSRFELIARLRAPGVGGSDRDAG